MKFFVELTSSTFPVSSSLANALKILNVSYQIQGKSSIFTLTDSHLALFEVIFTGSLTHFYVLVSGKKCRVNKKFHGTLKRLVIKEASVVEPWAGAGKKLSITLNKFYTKPQVARLCVSTALANINVQKQDLIIEPSAGNGAFIDPLKSVVCKKIFLDIRPENSLIHKIDFLS